MNSLNILLLPSWYPVNAMDVSGVFFRDQALALLEYGHKVSVVAANMRSLSTLVRGGTRRSGTVFENDQGIPTYRRTAWAALPLIPYGDYLLWRRVARAMLMQHVTEQGMPDVIHAHSAIYAGAVAVEWGLECGIPVVLTEHSSGFARKLYRPWQLSLAEKASINADACIAVSPALGSVMEDEFPQTRGLWEWVPNVVSDRFKYEKGTNGRPQRPVRFLSLAAMKENKGQMDLLEGFAGAFGNVSDTTEIWIGGDGPLRSALEARSRELGIRRRVHFLGQVPPGNVPALLAQVDGLVVTSHYETFSVVAAEALVAGIPVVATQCGGPEFIVKEGDGYLVPPREPKALAQALTQVAEPVQEFNSQAIAERANTRFSGRAVGRQLTAVYEKVLAGHP